MNLNNILKNKNFCLVVIGQIISLFGNSILRFALPLYILDKTNDPSIFSVILAISIVPTIILSPLGGVLADRINKKWIMVFLDFITSALIIMFSIFINIADDAIILITITLILLSIIQSFYQPSVQSSIPLLLDENEILNGNALVSLVNSTSNFLGPVLGGVLYGFFGILPLTFFAAICFFFAAIMELFIKIPHIKQKSNNNILKLIINDFKESTDFVFKKQPVILKTIIIAALTNLILSALIIIGLPVFIKINLKLSSQLYGLSEGMLAVGAICGAILVNGLSQKIPLKKFYIVLIIASLAIIPMSLPFIFKLPVMFSYILICLSCFTIMACCSSFSIRLMSFMQQQTPENILGKVISYILTLCTCALPIGQIIYGFLFNNFKSYHAIIILIAAFLSLIISICAKKSFANFK